ncbi:Bestrophin, RFP-TM, chloride channel-domain-containing protein [Schizophyllum amplum]|uniref:Bestrophin, RFP-TM, chloride channel-domain-containing protein n=1 Tax=Schizophyllum amplum TaxID=97359 RepID=A0A550CAG0_9AGAR|nr:Bestrophin, RFP-TM, chloride channel-domain-containing protein [Auriculariopsis ampla]
MPARTFPSFITPAWVRRKHLRKYSWLPDVLRVKGSIIRHIIGPVLTVTAWAALVAVLQSQGHPVELTNSVVPLLSVVVGLILVFRNGTSYDRYWEGRKCFATLTSNTRNLARLIWVQVAPPPTDDEPPFTKGKTPIAKISSKQLHRRKEDALRLCLSFVYATKHYLRGEDGMNYADFRGVLPASFLRLAEAGFNPKAISLANGSYDATRNNSNVDLTASDLTMRGDATKRIKVKRSKDKLPAISTPLLGDSHYTSVDFCKETSLPLPLGIAHEITRFLFVCRRDGCLETVGPAGVNAMNAFVSNMIDQLTSMERVANTPIPSSYGIHLKQCVTLYLFALPMTMVNALGWSVIPVVTIVAFTLMGIEGIADQIEMPFGMETSDLPLDRYCEDLKEEIHFMITSLPEGGEGMYGYDDGEGDD